MRACLLAVTVILIPWEVVAKQARDDWIDPNDMLNFDPSTGKMKKSKVEETAKVNVPPGSTPPAPPLMCPQCPEPSPAPPRDCTCEQAALPLMRQYIKTLLGHLAGQTPIGKSEDYTLHITLTEEDAGTLQRFVDSGNPKHIHDAHDVLALMIKHLTKSRLDKFEKTLLIIEDRIGISLSALIQLLALLALVSLILYSQVMLQIHWRRRITQVIVLLFLISVPWTWFELYKRQRVASPEETDLDDPVDDSMYVVPGEMVASPEGTGLDDPADDSMSAVPREIVASPEDFVAVVLSDSRGRGKPVTYIAKQAEIKQQSVAVKDIPPECQHGDETFWTYMKSIFTFEADKCHAYYEHVMIDPILKVPPTKAIAVTFVRFFVSPLKDVGTALSEFLRALLIDLPITLYPIALVMVALFSFLLLFMGFGYRIRLPFFVTIEPAERQVVKSEDRHLQQAIADTSQQITQQLNKLQQRMESSELAMSDKLQLLQQVQQAAIEYSLPSAPSTPTPSPSISRLAPSPQQRSKYTKYENSDIQCEPRDVPGDYVIGKDVSKTVGMNGPSNVDNTSEPAVLTKALLPAGDSNATGSGVAVPGSVNKCVVDTLVHDQSFVSIGKS